MKNLTIKTANKTIEIQVRLDDVVDYNYERDNEVYDDKAVCANVMGEIGDGDFFGQVQWDSQNNEYSADCDGNVLHDEIKKALLSNFSHEELYETGTNELTDSTYEIESDLYCDVMNDVLPQIVKFICDFGQEEVKSYLD